MPAEDIGESGLRIDVVELGCLNKSVGNCGGFASFVRAHEQVVFPAYSYTAHTAFSGVVVDTQATVIKIGSQPFEPRDAVADGSRQGRLARDLHELAVQPRFKIIDERGCLLLPDGFAFIGRLATNGSFYSVQRCDALQRFFRNAGALGNMDVKELTPDDLVATDLADPA